MMATNLNTKKAQGMKLKFYLAAAEGDGDLSALLAYADWLEENGHGLRAAHVRNRAEHYAALEGRTVTGHTWLAWHARYELGLIAEGLVSETSWKRFGYHGHYAADGRMVAEDNSLEKQLSLGYVPTLRRGSKRQVKLARIIEALGYRTFLIG